MKKIKIDGKPHTMIVLRILEWDEHGRPSKAAIGHEGATFKLDDGLPNHFMTAFVPAHMVEAMTRQ